MGEYMTPQGEYAEWEEWTYEKEVLRGQLEVSGGKEIEKQ